MKVYFYFSALNSCNSYLIVNENTKECIIVDPIEITEELISQIERKKLKLKAALLTENPHISGSTGLRTLLNIYSFAIHAAGSIIKVPYFIQLKGNGSFEIAGFSIEYFSQTDGLENYCMFKIKNVVFTGTIISAGINEKNNGIPSAKKLTEKLFLFDKRTIILPGNGPPSSVLSERFLSCKILFKSSSGSLRF